MQKRTKKHWGGDEGDDYPQVEKKVFPILLS
jgi:hypothetical protein